ncbi:MAG: class I SAM-dependent methyltransferase [Desulfomonilia bacterium]|nr:class I SAM-dependent methyltransferase [Desulfomonilia bacterium]
MKICFSCEKTFDSVGWNCPYCRSNPFITDGFFSFVTYDNTHEVKFFPEYYAQLFSLEEKHFWFRHRLNSILDAVQIHFPRAHEVLEVGCGTGNVLSSLSQSMPGLSLSGSDLFIEGLHFAKTRIPSAQLYQMDACRMPFENEFDLILALDVLEHIGDDTIALKEISKSLRPGGGVLITAPQHQWLWSTQDEKACHKRRYTRETLSKKIRMNGLRVVHMTSFITLLLPLLVISRFLASRFSDSRKEYDPFRELKIAPTLNRALYGICLAEGRMLKAGFSLPVGGSLLCMARKEH